MRLQPRREILEIWREVARYSFRNGAFIWAGGPDAVDSVSDAEQLLSILLPATAAAGLGLDLPDQTEDDAAEALRAIGDRHSLPRRLVRAMTDYMTRYSDGDGPTFRAGRYLRATDRATATLDVLESFALGVQLSLVALGFCRLYRQNLVRPDLITETDRLEELATFRLTCAMVGLVRCFTVHGFGDDSPHGKNLRRTVAQEHRAEPAVLAELERDLRYVRAGLQEATIGMRAGGLEPDTRFECGWSWALVAGSAPVEVEGRQAPDRATVAAALPHPYFSWIATDAVEALRSERTRLLGLLDEDQQRLARALELRLDLTRTYWARLATFGDHSWPLERLPWRATSGEESDYHSLAVTAITAAHFAGRPGNTDIALSHLTRVFARLARRNGIVRTPLANGANSRAALAGRTIPAPFENGGPPAAYRLTGFAPLLFDAVLRARRATEHEQLRDELAHLADLIWDHVTSPTEERHPSRLRRLSDDATPDWHNVLRFVEGLTRAMAFADGVPARAQSPLDFVHQLLAAADELVDTLTPRTDAAITSRLDRARRLIDEHPARAAALLYQVIAELDAATTAAQQPQQQPPA